MESELSGRQGEVEESGEWRYGSKWRDCDCVEFKVVTLDSRKRAWDGTLVGSYFVVYKPASREYYGPGTGRETPTKMRPATDTAGDREGEGRHSTHCWERACMYQW